MMSLRTRVYDSMTNAEMESYLEKNDVIFLPVGTAEMHGSMPLGCEHVLPLALATKMAEMTDGLVLSGLVYFYPGATAVARGTIQVSPSVGAAYLKQICGSLFRQGFRRQILLSYHGLAEVTLVPLVREFFEETKCLIVYMRPRYLRESRDVLGRVQQDGLGRLQSLGPTGGDPMRSRA